MSIEVKNLSFSYGNRPVLHDISFSVPKGEYVAIVGESGSGKSTLLRIINDVFEKDSGEIEVDGQVPTSGTITIENGEPIKVLLNIENK